MASCSAGSDTIVNGSSPGAMFVPPHVGTWFVLGTWDADTSGNKLKMIRTRVGYVAETGMAIYGKTNVVRFQDDSTESSDYVNYESNGNISVWDPYRQHWMTLPVATQNAIADSWSDTTFGGFLHKVVQTHTYAGREDIVLANHRFSAVKITDLYQEWTGGVESEYDGPASTY